MKKREKHVERVHIRILKYLLTVHIRILNCLLTVESPPPEIRKPRPSDTRVKAMHDTKLQQE
jgi:hypothetical protein